MKHLNDKTIQSYIDNELPESERKKVEMHLKECPSCRQRVETQRTFSGKMKKSLETLIPNDVEVPEFSFGRATRPEVNVNRIVLISSLATACSIALIAVLVNLLSKPKTPSKITTPTNLLPNRNLLSSRCIYKQKKQIPISKISKP